MPRTTERGQALQAIESALESTVLVYLMESSCEEDDFPVHEFEENIGDHLAIQEAIASSRYLYRGDSAGRHASHSDSLEEYIQHYPEAAFLALFRMHRTSFWQLVDLLTRASGPDYWGHDQSQHKKPGRPSKPIHQQIAVGLYVLRGGQTLEKSRIAMNIGYGMVWKYVWRTIKLLANLVSMINK